MPMETTRGWLFDCYPAPEGWVVWWITADGRRLRLLDEFSPWFYLQGPRAPLEATVARLQRLRVPLSCRPAERIELFSGRRQAVLQVFVHRPLLYPQVVERLIRTLDPRVQVFNCDLLLPQVYFFERGLFPLAFCELSFDDELRQRQARALDSPWDTDYALPDLRILGLHLEGPAVNPKHSGRRQLEVVVDGEARVLEPRSDAELVARLDQILRRTDPDVVLTEWGDSFLIPRLLELARRAGRRIAFHRDPPAVEKRRRESSYFSYGRIIYKAAAHPFFGRWHIDAQNCFLWYESEWEGLFEVARLTKLPVQHIARTSIGSGITSMQMEVAHRDGVLVPWRKREPEAFKSAADLINSDKGGLVYRPRAGFHENVAEIDFASMYPALMVSYNISPETVGCSCCPHNRLPEIRYTVCTRREGLVPKTLRPLLEKRARYKQLKRDAATPQEARKFQARQGALKWLLVVCFGYLGYKNARFGRIEAHEAVTALSREILLQAKEIAEERGFTMLHALVDSVWVHKPGAAVRDYQELADRIGAATKIPAALEGVYRWLHFLPSRTNPRLGVPNRYAGVFQDGSLKVRGLALRRHDTPPFVRRAQQEMLQILAAARNRREYVELLTPAQRVFEEALEELRSGRLLFEDVAITRHLSRKPAEYRKASATAVVAGELTHRGVRLNPGEAVQYVVTGAHCEDVNSRARAFATITGDWGYDVKYYEEQLRAAARELLWIETLDIRASRLYPRRTAKS